ncbi:fumarylacetoacetate hydrolase family protein [Undibacterium sp. TS12]|uniref:fumarylacetoacetate hydrolase family protein n=1 Tax=Undibacterium sp. TS12 TaxID=2908202 RepID=UPI001F4CB8D1|nr:fumarylacetoacetate hydrolase family protein [Undibacterium sp. TS12]MCH8622993.1 fumarylacetoacetate hydrolase family protein [Undibacterium sp. TS12]
MDFLFPPQAQAAVPIAGGTAFFPVHRIYCVGRNYVEHAKEMGWTGREPPFFFMKPADAVLPVAAGTVGEMPYPPMTDNLHHEVELVVAIGQGGKNIRVEDALSHIWGYAVGLDMTRRDLQAEAKDQGRPWCTAKGFDFSAPIGQIHRADTVLSIQQAPIRLDVNTQTRQNSDISKLIWSLAEIIACLSELYTLQPGDLIFTGTPAGVAAVQRGDLLEASITGLSDLKLRIV